MSAQHFSTAPAANPYDYRYVRSTACHEVYDTRDGRVLAFWPTPSDAENECNRLWYAELLRAQPIIPHDAPAVACQAAYLPDAPVVPQPAPTAPEIPAQPTPLADDRGALWGARDEAQVKRLLCVIKRGPAFDEPEHPLADNAEAHHERMAARGWQ